MPGKGEKYLDLHQVAERVGLSTKTIRVKVRGREFPPPFKWCGAFHWVESEIDRWMIRNAVQLEIRPEDMPEPKKSARKIAEDRGRSLSSGDDEEIPTSGKKKQG